MNATAVTCLFSLSVLAGIANAQFTTVINVPPDVSPESIGSDTQMNLFDGGVLEGVRSGPNSVPIFQVGSPDGTSQNVELNIIGGEAGLLDVYSGSVLNMTSGAIENGLTFPGSAVNISGGTIGPFFDVSDGSVVTISGGEFSGSFMASGQVNISDGSFTAWVEAHSGSQVTISGGTFSYDDQSGLFFSFGAANGSQVSISEGSFYSLLAHAGSELTISGGDYEYLFTSFSPGFATSGRLVISGGTVGEFSAVRDSEVLISGGTFDGFFGVHEGSQVEIQGSQFLLDGKSIAGLTEPGDSLALGTRGGQLLTSFLADGSPFDLVLNSVSVPFQDYLALGATLRLTLVPESSTFIMATLVCVGFIAFRLRNRLTLPL